MKGRRAQQVGKYCDSSLTYPRYLSAYVPCNSRLIRQGVPRGEDIINVVCNPNDKRRCMMKAKID
eukprot:3773134-Pleurochrysis_carterae.AAC.1